MAGSPPWFAWLSGLVSGLWSPAPVPGSHEAGLEEHRVGARLDRERRKPPGQRDEELIHALRLDYRRRQLANLEAKVAGHARSAAAYEQPAARECCAANGWVRSRLAASWWAAHDYGCQFIEQTKEELAAAEARRPPVLVAQPALHLHLPAALQQPPPRLDMCSACARRLQQAELNEQSIREHEAYLLNSNRRRGLSPAPAAAGAASQAAGRRAPAAADVAAGEAQAQPQQGPQQQQHAQQQQQGQLPCGDDSAGDGSEGAPATPTHLPAAPTQQHHSSSEQEQQEQEQETAEEQQKREAASQRPPAVADAAVAAPGNAL
ncbi:hypothetical protein COHA_008536 [Chlorella ohadii]|uniref:Uncharacterized protein n=1 Tax=Chlorella ohadii TaxID=2649997 RepID=A0AAD5DGI3_9CHLO|nr:hypothetical protein COHA_008536 [Chlorella ohadii]